MERSLKTLPGTDDQSVIQRVLEHVERRSTDTGSGVWREPVANYTSQSRLDADRTRQITFEGCIVHFHRELDAVLGSGKC